MFTSNFFLWIGTPETSEYRTRRSSNMEASETSPEEKTVPDVFKGRCVLVTGATGFVGKVLLEKLMRSCQEIKHIYVLIRATETQDARQRLETLFGQTVFDRVRHECPNMFTKVIPMSGNVSEQDCGLRTSDVEIIVHEVSIVLHCAANVRFDETFRRSVLTNVGGVKHILDLCHKIPRLAALVHVSTAYAFCNWEEIHEEVFPEKVTPQELLNVCKWLADEELEVLFEHLRNGRPSVYHYSKAIAEILLNAYTDSLPLCIVRPSIVTASWKEPFPGWVDTYNGPSGLIAACGKGLVKTVHVWPEIIADFIPVDVVAGTIIVAAWKVITSKGTSKLPMKIVNCTSNRANPVTWGEIEKICLPLLIKYPSMGLYRYPGGSFKKYSIAHRWSMVVNHMIPAYLVEAGSYLTFRRIKTVKLYKQINKVLHHLEYFTTNQFDFFCHNYAMLIEEMDNGDVQTFNVDIKELNWPSYFEHYVLGIRKYLLKERDETLPDARKRMNRIYYATSAVKLLALFGCAWIAYRHNERISGVLQKMYGFLEQRGTLMYQHIGKYLKL